MSIGDWTGVVLPDRAGLRRSRMMLEKETERREQAPQHCTSSERSIKCGFGSSLGRKSSVEHVATASAWSRRKPRLSSFERCCDRVVAATHAIAHACVTASGARHDCHALECSQAFKGLNRSSCHWQHNGAPSIISRIKVADSRHGSSTRNILSRGARASKT